MGFKWSDLFSQFPADPLSGGEITVVVQDGQSRGTTADAVSRSGFGNAADLDRIGSDDDRPTWDGEPWPGIGSVREAAGENLSALRVVYLDDGQAFAASATTALAYRLCGVTITAANIGSEVVIQQSGELTDASFNFTTDSPVFLGADGTLTQTPVESGALVAVARVITPTRIYIDLQQPIELTEV